jgi:hypothetical protein
MSRKIALLGAASLIACVVSACGGHDEGAVEAVSQPDQSLDTAQVLVLAQRTSENELPFQVNNGAVAIDDTSDTSQPISINTM